MENSIDETIKAKVQAVEKAYHQKLINNLKIRGWNLYCVGKAGTAVISEQQTEEFVSKGSEKECLQEAVSYQILPYVEDDSNWEKVKEKMNECMTNIRYPFWADMASGAEEDGNGNEKDYVKITGVYLVDSIIYEKPNYEFIVDTLFMHQLSMLPKSNGNIILNVNDVDKILKQLTLCERKEKTGLTS